MNPVELLNKELEKYERALAKSEHSFHVKHEISAETHNTHHVNDERLIEQYKQAIKILTRYDNERSTAGVTDHC